MAAVHHLRRPPCTTGNGTNAPSSAERVHHGAGIIAPWPAECLHHQAGVRIAVIQAGIVIVVITAVTDGVGIGDSDVGGAGSYGAVARTYILPNLPPAVKKKPPRP